MPLVHSALGQGQHPHVLQQGSLSVWSMPFSSSYSPDAPGIRPISSHPRGQEQRRYWLVKQEMVINELLLLRIRHILQGIVLAIEFSIQASQSWNKQGNAWGLWTIISQDIIKQGLHLGLWSSMPKIGLPKEALLFFVQEISSKKPQHRGREGTRCNCWLFNRSIKLTLIWLLDNNWSSFSAIGCQVPGWRRKDSWYPSKTYPSMWKAGEQP